MYDGQIRTVVALIILGGHFFVFVAGMALGFFGPLRGTDVAQVVLIASPVLAVTATAAIRFILDGQFGVKKGKKVSGVFAFIVVAFPTALIVCIFALFYGSIERLKASAPTISRSHWGPLKLSSADLSD